MIMGIGMIDIALCLLAIVFPLYILYRVQIIRRLLAIIEIQHRYEHEAWLAAMTNDAVALLRARRKRDLEIWRVCIPEGY